MESNSLNKRLMVNGGDLGSTILNNSLLPVQNAHHSEANQECHQHFRTDFGWIKLHRKILDSKVFHNEALFRLWMYCMLSANHKDTNVPVVTGRGSTEVHVKAGQFIYGRKSTARYLKWNESTTHKRMMKLEKMQNVDIQSNTHYSIITICNWAIYQSGVSSEYRANGHPSNTQVTNKYQPSNIDNNDKNVKNDKKSVIPPKKHDLISFFEEMGSSKLEAEKFYNYYSSNGWKVSQNLMKDWNAAAKNWILKSDNRNINWQGGNVVDGGYINLEASQS
jgi:hypothetical protein